MSEQVSEKLGDRHMDTLNSINNLGVLLKARGDLAGVSLLTSSGRPCGGFTSLFLNF